jgi:LacI family transcriptional regulator, galactose operon repressor
VSITIADVAARAGVSKTTVSRVLNGKGELDASTAARVRQVISDLGYVPSARAVGLARGRTRVVGMLVPTVTWPWMGEVLQGAVDVLEGKGYGLMLFTCSRGESSMRAFASRASARSFDGLLAIEPEGTLDIMVELHAGGLPVLLIDDRGELPEFPCVVTANRDGAGAAARHLLAIGRRRPLVISGGMRFGCTRQRLAGFADAYAAAGLPLAPEQTVEGDFTFKRGVSAINDVISRGVPFDAVFAHNDLAAGGAMHALRAAGRSVPGDVAVVGFDDVAYAQWTDPPLTTVRQPMRQLGEVAARMIVAHFGGTPLPRVPHMLPTTLVVRGSTVSS